MSNLDGLDAEARQRLAPWRRVVLETAALHPAIGEIAESLKWGEPSYAPARRNIGSSVRLACREGGQVALLFICNTGLIEQVRTLYPATFKIEGNRAIVFDPVNPPQVEALRHAVTLALTYFLRRPKRKNPLHQARAAKPGVQ